MSSLLVTAEELLAHVGNPDWRVFDCRHDLENVQYGENAYIKGHVPGALFLHLDRDLSGEKNGSNGRHPLPDPEAFARRMSECGVGPDTQVVAYDNEGGVFAARFWWMLHWLGHDKAALLDGGLAAWRKVGKTMSSEVPTLPLARFAPRPRSTMQVDAGYVQGKLGARETLVLDARAPERFTGEEEILDPVAGHIPGAINRFWFDNLDDNGIYFKSPEELRADFHDLLAGRDPASVVQQCGSGVTACHNILAMEIAGLKGSKLYPGSWSEWCADPARPIATGE
ncbi:MAG: sulfurtransferase [Gammaproteobacteria bacterium]|nr:sulfurtransferase [Gammaproteobacteria bacterium]MBU1415050.1 sulfurtransferase [Gammaproteobacteria bacterium]